MTSTHSVDARQLLRELEDDSNNDWLTIVWGAEKLKYSHFLFQGHLHCFLLHLLNIFANIFTATQTNQCYKEKKGYE